MMMVTIWVTLAPPTLSETQRIHPDRLPAQQVGLADGFHDVFAYAGGAKLMAQVIHRHLEPLARAGLVDVGPQAFDEGLAVDRTAGVGDEVFQQGQSLLALPMFGCQAAPSGGQAEAAEGEYLQRRLRHGLVPGGALRLRFATQLDDGDRRTGARTPGRVRHDHRGDTPGNPPAVFVAGAAGWRGERPGAPKTPDAFATGRAQRLVPGKHGLQNIGTVPADDLAWGVAQKPLRREVPGDDLQVAVDGEGRVGSQIDETIRGDHPTGHGRLMAASPWQPRPIPP